MKHISSSHQVINSMGHPTRGASGAATGGRLTGTGPQAAVDLEENVRRSQGLGQEWPQWLGASGRPGEALKRHGEALKRAPWMG